MLRLNGEGNVGTADRGGVVGEPYEYVCVSGLCQVFGALRAPSGHDLYCATENAKRLHSTIVCPEACSDPIRHSLNPAKVKAVGRPRGWVVYDPPPAALDAFLAEHPHSWDAITARQAERWRDNLGI